MPIGLLDEQVVLERLRERLAERLRALVASQGSAQSAATHPEARPEDPKDMRSTEASYVARGLAARVETLTDAVAELRALRPSRRGTGAPIALGSLVALENDDTGEESLYFLAPAGGGETLDAEGRVVNVITPASPLGRALVGRRLADEIEVELPRGRAIVVVADLR